MTPEQVLTSVTLAISGWTLLQVVAQGKQIAAIRQQLKDLPCRDCSHDDEDDN